MKNTFLKIMGTALVILSLAFAQVQVFAQNTETEDQSKEQTQENLTEQSGGERLAGTWDAQVTIRNCQTGAAIRTFASIGTFMPGGTVIVSESNISPALKTPAHGVWSHTGGNMYRFRVKAFNFDAIGNFTGWMIISQQLSLDHQANVYEAAGTAEFYAPNGILVATGCSTVRATRFE